MQTFCINHGYRQCIARTVRRTAWAGHSYVSRWGNSSPYTIDDSLPGPGPSSLAAAVAAPSATSNSSAGAGPSSGGRGGEAARRDVARGHQHRQQRRKQAASGPEGAGAAPPAPTTSILDVAAQARSADSDSESDDPRPGSKRGSGRRAADSSAARGRGGQPPQQQQQQQRDTGGGASSSSAAPATAPGGRKFRSASVQSSAPPGSGAAAAAVAAGAAAVAGAAGAAAERSNPSNTNSNISSSNGGDGDKTSGRSAGRRVGNKQAATTTSSNNNNKNRGRSQAEEEVEEEEDDFAGAAPPSFLRLPDGRQLVPLRPDTVAAGAAGALSRALGMEGKAVVRFDGAAGGLKGLRVLTLAHVFMGAFGRGLSFVVDVRQSSPSAAERPQAGDVSFGFRVMARSRPLEAHEARLGAALREARFVLDLSINVRQAWDCKGDIDEEQAYDLADTFYAALAAQQADEDAEEAAAAGGARSRRQQQSQQRGGVGAPDLPPPGVFVTADLAQGLTTLAALGLLQKRLREEGQNVVVESTVYRASTAAPRLDGRDGYIFGLRLGRPGPYLSRGTGQAAASERQ